MGKLGPTPFKLQSYDFLVYSSKFFISNPKTAEALLTDRRILTVFYKMTVRCVFSFVSRIICCFVITVIEVFIWNAVNLP